MLAFLELISNPAGVIGVILTLLAYYLLNVNKLKSTSLLYVWLNLIGAAMLLYSLLFHWNLASVLIEVAWIVISFIGLYRVLKARH